MDFSFDPLEEVVEHKDIVRHLINNGIDGHEIYKMLCDCHDWEWEFPVNFSEEDKTQRKEATQALRFVSGLITSRAITEVEKNVLHKIKLRLERDYPSFKKKSGQPVIKVLSMDLGVGPATDVGKYPAGKVRTQPKGHAAKTEKQIWGLQVVEMHNYINQFITNNHLFLQNDIYDLIAEVFKVTFGLKFTREQVKNFHTNNFKYLPELK